MTPLSELRDYQIKAVEDVRHSFSQGYRAVCLVAPTGAGKTRIALEIAIRAVQKGKKILWLSHRLELLNQIQSILQIPPVYLTNIVNGVEITTIQSLYIKPQLPKADLIIIDECHHYESDEWSRIYEDYKSSWILGLTATPARADGRGLKHHYDSLVVAANMAELRNRNILVPIDIYCPTELLRAGRIAQDPYKVWRDYAEGKKTIIYCGNIEHAKHVLKSFNSAHIVTSESPPFDRAAIIENFRQGKFKILVNVNILTEGFDVPDVECVILARGISHASTYLQIVGRALRAAPNKEKSILIDLRGVTNIHGDPYEERIYSLDGKGIRRKTDQSDRYCPVCTAIINDLPCDSCGYDTEEARQIRILNSPLVRFAKKREEQEKERRKTLDRWKWIARSKGYKKGWITYKYKATYGDWPPREWL